MTVLSACRAVNIEVPTLCNDDQTKNHGRCRLCYVEINGRLQLACETIITDGMQIITNSELIIEKRKVILSLLIKEHYFNCPICDKSARCDFQKIATEYDVKTSDNFVYATDPGYINFVDGLAFDKSKCISCGKCIKRISNYNIPNPDLFIKHNLNSTKHYKPSEIVFICPTAALRENDD